MRALLWSLLLLFFPLCADESTGMLVVSYQTGPEGERLDRIRFRLIDERQHQRLFPQGTNYACDAVHPNRVVAIDDLLPGIYTIEFLVPNADGLFGDIPKRTVSLLPGQRVKIDQYFHPRYASLKATAKACAGIPPFVTLPAITLIDSLQQVRARSDNGELTVKNLLPGNYRLIFEEMAGYTTPADVPITVGPGEEAGPFTGHYGCDQIMPNSLEENSSKLFQCISRVLTELSALLFPPLCAAEGNSSHGYGQITIHSNMPEGRWIIYRNDLSVYEGKGSESGIPVTPASNYRLRYQELDGYHATVIPADGFRVDAGKTVTVSVKYQKSYGKIDIRSSMSKGGTLKVLIVSKTPGLKSMDTTIRAKDGKIDWTSPLLPTGSYTVTFEPSAPYIVPQPQTVQVSTDKNALVAPDFSLPKTLKVITGFPQALFTLSQEKGDKEWKGSGKEFIFKDVLPGTYRLSFQSPSPDLWRAPADQRVSLSPYQDVTVRAAYVKLGKLAIQTNAQGGTLILTSGADRDQPIRHEVHMGLQTITLPEGDYGTEFQPVLHAKVKIPPSSQIKIRGGMTESVRIAVEAEEFQQPAAAQPLFLPPPSKTTEMVYLDVEGGESIMGDFHGDGGAGVLPAKTVDLSPFSISAYEVTNAQYAHWLNAASSAGKVVYRQEGDQKGVVNDLEGRPLCKTLLSEPQSQLSASLDGAKKVTFSSVPDKADHPVIFVSWYGAAAFCADNDCRLPTEAEWEKAAGMQPSKPPAPLKKFKYGFSRDSIDPTWANYYDGEGSFIGDAPKTTVVGFYNGTHLLPSGSETVAAQATHKAVSPIGAYDMSGNVSEWTADWFAPSYPLDMPLANPKGPQSGDEKVAKGGSYRSGAKEVRVAGRLALPPGVMNGSTGFRVAK